MWTYILYGWAWLLVCAAMLWVTRWIFCFTQRPVSLHWTVKCSNLFLLEPDGSSMGVKIVAGIWYMGFPLLTLGSPFLLHITTRAPILSQREMENTLSQCGWREWGLKKLFSSCQNEICSVSAAVLHVQCPCVVWKCFGCVCYPLSICMFSCGTVAFRFLRFFVPVPWF